MAYYRVGDTIRLARKSMGLSQEELAFRAGVATETISRIESGKHKVTQETYRKIMEPLNRFSERSYAICTGEDVGILEEKKLLDDAEAKYEIENRQAILDRLKKGIGDSAVNRQYILRAEAILEYTMQRIDEETLIRKLTESLQLTIGDDVRNMNLEGYPFTEQETIILMNIASAYASIGCFEKAERMNNMILNSLDSGYTNGTKKSNLYLVIMRNLSRTLEGLGKYEEAFHLLETILEKSIEENYGLMLSIALYEISWNMEKINSLADDPVFDLEEIRKKKRQAYYIAAARNDNYVREITRKSYENLFHEAP